MDKIPVCVAYEVDGVETSLFPTGDRLVRAKPVYRYLDGFSCDVSKCRKQSELPENAVKYIKYLEQLVGCKIKYVSVGASREDYVVMDD